MALFGPFTQAQRGAGVLTYFNTDEVLCSGRASLAISASPRGGASARATIRVSATPTGYTPGATATATLPSLTAHPRGGARASATLPALAAAAVGSAVYSATARATLRIALGRRERARATLPPLRVAARSSAVLAKTPVIWCTTLSLGETTRWTGLDFLHVIRLGATTYGVATDGLYALGAADDDGVGITSTVTTHPADFGTFEHKRVPYVYLGNADAVTVTPTVDGTAGAAGTADIGSQRVRLERGAKGRYWSFQIVNTAGKRLSINGLLPYTVPVGRRV